MLTTLLESRAHQARRSHFMVASATVHAVIIFAAAGATAMSSAAEASREEIPVIHWVPMPQRTTPVFAGASHSSAKPPTATLVRAQPAFSVDVPTSLPSIELELAPMGSDFVPRQTGNGDSTSLTASIAAGGDGRRAYDVTEVEVPVVLIGRTIPEYPAALRASGIEGVVAAEFVVTGTGRADLASLRIISATNDVFAESIRRALPRMRFRAAKIGGREVPQLVRQSFVFRLDR